MGIWFCPTQNCASSAVRAANNVPLNCKLRNPSTGMALRNAEAHLSVRTSQRRVKPAMESTLKKTIPRPELAIVERYDGSVLQKNLNLSRGDFPLKIRSAFEQGFHCGQNRSHIGFLAKALD